MLIDEEEEVDVCVDEDVRLVVVDETAYPKEYTLRRLPAPQYSELEKKY